MYNEVLIYQYLVSDQIQSSNMVTESNVNVTVTQKVSQKYREKQEAFRERRRIRVCEFWPWEVTLTFRQGQ